MYVKSQMLERHYGHHENAYCMPRLYVCVDRAVASVEVPPLRENQGVLIGWIQACTEMRFINSYGKHGV